jgi:hypothetical protein
MHSFCIQQGKEGGDIEGAHGHFKFIFRRGNENDKEISNERQSDDTITKKRL